MFAREVLSRGFGRRRGKFRVGDSDAGNFGGKCSDFVIFFFFPLRFWLRFCFLNEEEGGRWLVFV